MDVRVFGTTNNIKRIANHYHSTWHGHWYGIISYQIEITYFYNVLLLGHSIHGGIPESQFMSRVLRGIILMKSAPLLANIITDLTPVDFVAVACTHILRHELIAKCEIGRNRVKCYHLWNDRFISFLDIAECFRFNGFNIEDVAYDKWLAQINKSNPKKYVTILIDK